MADGALRGLVVVSKNANVANGAAGEADAEEARRHWRRRRSAAGPLPRCSSRRPG
ncbi:MAG: hypothetical protein R2716_03250 [Microthrixaceae bacterium]